MRKNTTGVKWVMSLIIAIPSLFFMQTNTPLNAEEPLQVNLHQESVTLAKEGGKTSSILTEKKESLDQALIEKRTDQFMNQLVQETDQDYKVKNYASKQELLESFEPFAKQEAAEEYVHYYYEEKQSGLYILPTETPPWFVNGQTYDTIDIDDTHKKIVQTNESDLYGEYTIAITFEYEDTWRIKEIEHK